MLIKMNPGNLLILKFFSKKDCSSRNASTNRPYTPTNQITPYHLCILHLAFADLLTCVLSVIWSVYQYINYSVLESRIDGPLKIFFNFLHIAFVIVIMTSSGISFILSVERYFKIASPFGGIRMNKPLIHALCALFYILSAIGAFPTDFIIKNDIETEKKLNIAFYLFGGIISLVIPVLGKNDIISYRGKVNSGKN